MATEFGKDWRLYVTPSGGGAAVPLGGERTTRWARASNDVDTSDKDGPSGIFTPGRVTFAVQGNVKLPDAAIVALFNAAKSGEVLDIEFRKGAVVKYANEVTVGNFSADFDQQGAVPYSFDLSAAGIATVDSLGATA